MKSVLWIFFEMGINMFGGFQGQEMFSGVFLEI